MSRKLLSITLILFLTVACSRSFNKRTSVGNDDKIKINVALYPYLYDGYKKASETILTKLWYEKHPEVEVKFVEYNAYKNKPFDSVDVFVLDAIYLSSFAEKGWILPIPDSLIDQKDDILPHSLQGCIYKEQYFGIPQFGCANILFYRKDDLEIENASSLDELYKILGKASFQTPKPPKNKGLIADFSSGTGNVCWYVEAAMDQTGNYTTSPKLVNIDEINSQALANVQKLVQMAGTGSMEWNTDRPEWFDNGLGRCYIGYTENMFQMPKNLNQVSMKLIPSYKESDVDLFFMDAAVINAKVAQSKKKTQLAIEMVNLIASSSHMIKSCSNKGSAYYYMPARKSVFTTLQSKYPKYKQMYDLIQASEPKVFRLGTKAFDLLNNTDYKDDLDKVIFEE